MKLFESRASLILYNILVSNKFRNKFLLPLNICPIVPITFLKAKIDFEFIDIQLDNLCISQEIVMERILKGDISGVLFAHTFGVEVNTDDFFDNIKAIDSSIFIIDDRCLMVPSFECDIESSSIDLILYSTGYVKYVDVGWGAYAFLKDCYEYKNNKICYSSKDLDNLLKNIQVSINRSVKLEYKDTSWLGSDISPYKNFLSYKKDILKKLPHVISKKNKLNKIYYENIPKELHLGEEFSIWRFSIIVDNKEEILNTIFKNNLFASSHYKEVDFLFKLKTYNNSNSKQISSKIINLFNDFRFTCDMAYDISRIIRENVK